MKNMILGGLMPVMTLALYVSSCTNDNVSELPGNSSADVFTIKASIDNMNPTRATVSPTDGTCFIWQNDDKFHLYQNTDLAKANVFAIDKGSIDVNSADFICNDFVPAEGASYYAFYPQGFEGESSTFTYTIPESVYTQTGNNNTDHLKNGMIMVAGGESSALQSGISFTHKTALFIFRVANSTGTDINVKSLRLYSAGTECFAGKFSYTIGGAETESEKKSELSLGFGEGVAINEGGELKAYALALPGDNFSSEGESLTVEVTTGQGLVLSETFDLNGLNSFEEGKYYSFTVSDWNIPSEETPEENLHEIIIKPAGTPFVHPGALHTQEDIDYARSKKEAGESPWINGYNQILRSNHFDQQTKMPALQPNPTEKIVRGGRTVWEPDPDNYNNAANQAHAAYQYAIMWKMTDNTDYAEAAIDILNAWARTCKSLNGDSNVSLAAGLYGYQFANAGELMRDYTGWEAEDFAAYQKWMVDVFYVKNDDFLVRHHGAPIMNYWANWDLANLASMLSIGILADRRDIYNQAVEYLLEGDGNGCLQNTIVHVFDGENEGLAQIQESGRDQGHSTLVIGLLGVIGQITWSQGDDFWGYNDNVILKASEYVAKYNVAMLDVPFVYYNNPVHGLHTAVSEISRGSNRPMWEMIYAHYSTVKNVAPEWSQYTLMGVDSQRPETATQTGNSGGVYDLLGCGTLMYAR